MSNDALVRRLTEDEPQTSVLQAGEGQWTEW